MQIYMGPENKQFYSYMATKIINLGGTLTKNSWCIMLTLTICIFKWHMQQSLVVKEACVSQKQADENGDRAILPRGTVMHVPLENHENGRICFNEIKMMIFCSLIFFHKQINNTARWKDRYAAQAKNILKPEINLHGVSLKYKTQILHICETS